MAAVRFIEPPPILVLLLLFLSFLLFNPISSITDTEALLKLKESFTNPSTLNSWSPKSEPCKTDPSSWAGVRCYQGIVGDLRLGKMGLSGEIDIDALAELKGLRTISFTRNLFEGPIPEFTRLTSLKAIYLSGNKFSGDIPKDYFGKMTSLKKIWLSENEFTGEIPISLVPLPNILELHLEDNKFTGKIPAFAQKTMESFNVSNNELEGQIPAELDRFDASSFEGNEGLCGSKLKECETPASESDGPPHPEKTTPHSSTSTGKLSTEVTIAAVILALVLVGLVFATIAVVKRRKEDFNVLAKDKFEQEASVARAALGRKQKDVETGWKRSDSKNSTNSKGGSVQSKGGSVQSKGSINIKSSSRSAKSSGMGDLKMVNDEKGVFGLPDLMKAAAEVLGNGGLGSAYKAVMSNGVAVVVKRMREMNKLGKEDFGEELRKFGSLRHPNVLPPLAYHYRKEEKLVISEYIPKGSLLYLLHGDRGPCHNDLDWPARLKIVKGIARGLEFIHTVLSSLEIPHGNLKSSNIFLGSEYEPLLADYGFCKFVNAEQAAQALFSYKAPESLFYQQFSLKCDIYCFGIVILEILTGKFPSQYLSNGKGGTDVVQWVVSAIAEKREAEVFDPEIANSTNSLGEMEKLLHIGAVCIEIDPSKRPELPVLIKRIEDVQIYGAQDGRGVQTAPTLRDGYADQLSLTSHANTSHMLEGYGELSGRRAEIATERGAGTDSFAFNIS